MDLGFQSSATYCNKTREWIEEMQKGYEIHGRAGSYKPPNPGFRFEV